VTVKNVVRHTKCPHELARELFAFDRSGREAPNHGGDVAEKDYPEAAVERAMKVQEVIMRAMAKRITS
jgi:hypothetical protein